MMAVRLLLVVLGRASGLRPSGPPPGGRVLPEANPVIPPGCVAPMLAAHTAGSSTSNATPVPWSSARSVPSSRCRAGAGTRAWNAAHAHVMLMVAAPTAAQEVGEEGHAYSPARRTAWVGNIPLALARRQDDLRSLLSQFGEVEKMTVRV